MWFVDQQPASMRASILIPAGAIRQFRARGSPDKNLGGTARGSYKLGERVPSHRYWED